jgi:3D (Asp-Asp-Asp) domain-containing protein
MSRRCVFGALIGALTIQLGCETRSKPIQPPMSVSATAYCIEGRTKSGAWTRKGIVAADPRVLPLGTLIQVSDLGPYDGTYAVKDTGRSVKGREIDIFMDDCAAATRFGRRQARVVVLERPSTGRSSRQDR